MEGKTTRADGLVLLDVLLNLLTLFHFPCWTEKSNSLNYFGPVVLWFRLKKFSGLFHRPFTLQTI